MERVGLKVRQPGQVRKEAAVTDGSGSISLRFVFMEL